MIKKIRLKTFKNITRHFPLAHRKLGKTRKGHRGLFLFASVGCAFLVILLLCLLMRQNARPFDHDAVQITIDQKSDSLGAKPSLGISETEAWVITKPPETAWGGEVAVMAPTDGKQESTPEPTLSPASEPTPSPTPVDFDELIAFYNLEADHYYSDYGYSSNHYAHTDEELYMLAQLIYGEARGESTKGKIAVANVVMNRVLSRGYPGDTIKAVITASGQFSGYSASNRPNSACVYAARQVLEKEVWVIPQNVYFFQSDKPAGEDWGGHKYYTKIGGHCFYTENYSGRNRNGKIPPALYERVFKWPQYGCEPGKRVYRLQYMLNKLGYAVKADSYFGQTTKEAVVAFQTDHRLKADGVAGPSTIKALIKAYGESAYCAKFP